MENTKDKIVRLLENFMSELQISGICGFWVDEEEDDHGMYWVYIILDEDNLEDHPTKPGYVANKYRLGVQSEIKNFLGLDVRVGSISKSCSE